MEHSRCAGVLLHPTSLPGPLIGGDIGHEAYRFIEFLNANGFKVWQMLPLGPTHEDGSPYQCLSAHAGNPALISLDWLVDRGWLCLESIAIEQTDSVYRPTCLNVAITAFQQHAGADWNAGLARFREEQAYWLKDYALFMALKQKYRNKPWFHWPDKVRERDPESLQNARQQLFEIIEQIVIEQFIFFTQWREVRDYACRHDIKLFGDMPIFVAHDSADVWAQRDNFKIDSEGVMTHVAGVPPDAFTEEGQKWGNPLYDWKAQKSQRFEWWINRLKTQLQLYDWIRFDHFRGLDACWEIPAEDDTAANGHWCAVPGHALLETLTGTFNDLPIIAEDLGVITESVIKLKNDYSLPGMKVLQFAFDGNTNNPHLPHRHNSTDVIYTGTHDNDTSLGWLKDESQYNPDYFDAYTGCCGQAVSYKIDALWRMALSSVSFLCVFPMQDLLLLDSKSRMNTPGTTQGNWGWRFDWSQVDPDVMHKMNNLLTVYQR